MRQAYREYYALFMATLIREEHVKGSKSLPAFKLFSIKSMKNKRNEEGLIIKTDTGTGPHAPVREHFR